MHLQYIMMSMQGFLKNAGALAQAWAAKKLGE
jgi:hypothetical protein